MKRALTIAGSDCSGGAGIQADLKTFMAFKVFGMSVVTAVVAENTIGVQAVHDIPVDIVEQQIKSCLDDIGTDAVKIGMLSNPEIVEVVANAIRKYNLQKIVLDPVMVAKSGDPLLSESAREVVRELLLPLSTIITPNLPEAEVLLNRKIESLDDMAQAAIDLKESGCQYVVVKGGHLLGGDIATDVFYDGEEVKLLKSPYFDTKNTHGTGCTFSSAIASGLAKGFSPMRAIRTAKDYITSAIRESHPLGHGHGPTNHLTGVESKW